MEEENEFQTNYIYLDYEERRTLSGISHDYLIMSINKLKMHDMILWKFVCRNSDIWGSLPNEIQYMILKEIQNWSGHPLLFF